MTKMMKETNSEIESGNIWNGFVDSYTITYRISKASALFITGLDDEFDCESVFSGSVYFENGKAYLEISADSQSECDAIANDLIYGRL